METLMPTTIYTLLAHAANEGCDIPATLIGHFKDMAPGTRALLSLLRGTGGKPDMIHIAWRTMAHDQPADVMSLDEAEARFDIISGQN